MLFLAIFLLTGVTQAHQAHTKAHTNDLPKPGILPDSPFYFLKSWSESIGTFFTFGGVAKAERLLNLSKKRLAEAKALSTKGKPALVEKTIKRYQDQWINALTKARETKAKGLDTDEVLAKVAEATLKHQVVLADIYERVPEQAKPAIERAMIAGMHGNKEALTAVSGEKRAEILQRVEQKRQEAEQRLEDLRNKGIPIPPTPTREDIEQRIPARPKTETPETPGQPPIQKQEQQTEATKPQVPTVESEIPGSTGKPQTPRRP